MEEWGGFVANYHLNWWFSTRETRIYLTEGVIFMKVKRKLYSKKKKKSQNTILSFSLEIQSTKGSIWKE